ncbi:hypothetical protein [Desulfospira joergensenii]|uniref:hypothetical protein n=1 Tax=Desulfospira joergensenii TaxID=53329 RepID=UPI0003B4C1FD|nr:hypothetical protein [Desulfospira joergensenii]
MNISIETKALKSFLYGILSCKCPVTEKTEKKLFNHFYAVSDQQISDFNPVLSIADENPERTPIHNLFDLCAGSRDNPNEFTITLNDVLRYLGSVTHYNMVVSGHPGIEFSNPGLLVSHLLLPVIPDQRKEGVSVKYEREDIRIRFDSVFWPEGSGAGGEDYAMHMGVVVCRLTKEQAKMLHMHQAMIRGFAEAAGRISMVDFRDLPPYGDHVSQVIERFQRNMPAGPASLSK